MSESTPITTFEPEPPPEPSGAAGASRVVNEGLARVFPCGQCGADLEFRIGHQELQCPYCGHLQQLEIPADQPITEQDLPAMLERLRLQHEAAARPEEDAGAEESGAAEGEVNSATVGDQEVHCDGCGANVLFTGTLTSTRCPYCGGPIQRNDVHKSEARIPVDGVLPFFVVREKAASCIEQWVQSRWFAPNDFKKLGAKGKFEGVYLPYFTFDAMTFNRYEGQRGDHYNVTTGSGKDRKTERRTRWSYASGQFQRFFDDVLILAVRSQRHDLAQSLEPWPLEKCVPFTPDAMAGIFARTYDIQLDQTFELAQQRMRAALMTETKQLIGGDEQRVDDLKTKFTALTFKHLLLPVWLMAYRYRDKTYPVMVNAVTGEVSGDRPYSWIKISLAILAGAAVALTIFALTQR